jgi:hypothetical protein
MNGFKREIPKACNVSDSGVIVTLGIGQYYYLLLLISRLG